MPLSQLPAFVAACFADLSATLDRRSAVRLLLLIVGALFAKGRRTVTSWFRAAGITSDFRPAYNALWAAGRRADALACRLLCLALKPLMRHLAGDHVLFALDDTPTARYGPKVQGAGIHQNPTPGPAGEKFVYGHLWARSRRAPTAPGRRRSVRFVDSGCKGSRAAPSGKTVWPSPGLRGTRLVIV